MIKVLQNDKEIFYGEVREITDNFDFTKHIYAVGELAFLFDSIQPQKKYQCSPAQMFTEMINIHNSQVEAKKRFKIGEISVKDANDYVYHFTNREDTLTAIRDKLCNSLNGYLKITKQNGERYINLVSLDRYGSLCTQEIQFGENLLDYAANNSAVNIATAVVPVGARLEDENRTKRAIEGLDEYVSIVDTSVDDYHKNKSDDFVVNDVAVSQFGYIRVVKEWSDVTVPENLKTKAIEWLKQVQFAELTLNVSAFDLNLMDVNIDSYDLGDRVSVWAIPFGMENVIFPIQKKTIHMNDITKNSIVLGNKFTKSYTSQASKAVETIKEEIPEITPLLKKAQDDALAILTDPKKGYVTYIFDENGNRTEIWIADNMDSRYATRKWVWNSGGLGYLYKVNGEWKSNVAMTIDGKIFANMITAGTMLADRVRGGKFIVGGTETGKDGSILVQNTKGETLVTLDKNGLKLSNGQKIEYGDISGAPTKTSDLTNDGDGKGTAYKTVITGNDITTGTIDAQKCNITNINASNITSGFIDASKIAVEKINADKITTGTINGKDINIDNINASNIKSGVLSGVKVEQASGNDIVTIENGTIKMQTSNVANSGLQVGWGSNSGYFTAIGAKTDGVMFASSFDAQGSVNGQDIYARGKSSADTIEAHNYHAVEDGLIYDGQDTDAFAFYATNANGEQVIVTLKFVDGLLVYKSGV